MVWINRVAGVACALILAAAACGRPVVVIHVKNPPDIDPSVYKRVAVLPFEGEGDAEKGLLVAKAIREALEKKGSFLVENPEVVEGVIDRMPAFKPGKREDALAVGRELGVDLVITGRVHFFERVYSDEGSLSNELYTADKRSIPPFEYGSAYTQSNLEVRQKYTLEVTVKALAVESGRLVRRRELERTTEETYKRKELSLSPKKEEEIFQGLLGKVINDFAYGLDTHEVSAEREVAKF